MPRPYSFLIGSPHNPRRGKGVSFCLRRGRACPALWLVANEPMIAARFLCGNSSEEHEGEACLAPYSTLTGPP